MDTTMDDKRLAWGMANAVVSDTIKLRPGSTARSGLTAKAELIEAVIARLTKQAHGLRHPTIITGKGGKQRVK